jgi:nucleotide-binding universal stress UspA family protein/uncharacterized protein YjgD (DUF1641 family)
MAEDTRTILVAIDSLKDAERAILPAIELAKSQGGRIVALSAINVTHTSGVNLKELYESIKKKKADPALKKVRELCAEAGVDVITRVEKGSPGQVLAEVARKEKADIVLMRPTSRKGIDEAGKGYGILKAEEGKRRPVVNLDPSGVLVALDSDVVACETEEVAELLGKIVGNIDSFSDLVTRMVSLNELLEDSAPIIKGAFDKSLPALDSMGKEMDAEEVKELISTFMKNTEAFSSLVKRLVSMDELMKDYAPIMKGAFNKSLLALERVDRNLDTEEAAVLFDTVTRNLGTFSTLVQKMVAINELMEDVGPIMKGAFDKSLVFLDELGGDLDPEEAGVLLRKFIQNISTFSYLLDRMSSLTELMEDTTPIMKSAFQKSLAILQEVDRKLDLDSALELTDTVLSNMDAFSSLAGKAVGVHELMEDMQPIIKAAFDKSLVKLDALQRDGTIDRVAKFAQIMEMVFNNFSDEDLERLGLNLLLTMDLLNRAMQPEVVSVVHGMLDTVVTCQRQYMKEGPKKIGMFNYVSVMRDQDIQMAVGFLTNFLKNFNNCIDRAQRESLAGKDVEQVSSRASTTEVQL